MKLWSCLIVAALVATPALADKKKDDKKAAAQAPAASAQQNVVAEAEAKLAAGDADGAAAMLEKAAGSDPRAGIRLGALRESRGELDTAIDALRAAAEKADGATKAEALGRLAVVQYTRGMAEAGASAEAALAADPEGVWPTIAAAYRLAAEGKAEEAVAAARKAAGAGGGSGASAALGRALAVKGDMVGAEAAYREAVAADAGALRPAIGLASVLRQTGRAAEAEPLLAKVIEASPGAVPAYKEMARVKIALGRAQDALADASLAAALGEGDTEAEGLVVEVKVARALESLAQGQVDSAVLDLAALRDEKPASLPVRLALARAQVARRDADAAIAELKKATELEPRSAEAHYQLGDVLHTMKQNAAAAVPAFEAAVAAEPDDLLFRTAFGAALSDAGQVERAVAELGTVVGNADYSGWRASFYLGAAQLKAQRYKEAAEALEKSLAVKADNAQAEGYLAWAYFGLKDAANFKVHGAKAKDLGFKDPQLFDRLTKVEAGQPIK